MRLMPRTLHVRIFHSLIDVFNLQRNADNTQVEILQIVQCDYSIFMNENGFCAK
jgi:hypothetical protein